MMNFAVVTLNKIYGIPLMLYDILTSAMLSIHKYWIYFNPIKRNSSFVNRHVDIRGVPRPFRPGSGLKHRPEDLA